MDQEYFTIPEVATKLKVSRAAVYKWIAQGRLEAIYVGADRRITSDAIAAFIKGSTAAHKGSDEAKSGDIEAPAYAVA